MKTLQLTEKDYMLMAEAIAEQGLDSCSEYSYRKDGFLIYIYGELCKRYKAIGGRYSPYPHDPTCEPTYVLSYINLDIDEVQVIDIESDECISFDFDVDKLTKYVYDIAE